MGSKDLKIGFTTGTAAAAAAKGALYLYLTGKAPSEVEVELLTGDRIVIPLHTCAIEGIKTVCTVIKDAGDDPDVTHKAEIGAKVMILDNGHIQVTIAGGKGVGKVTKPGLEVPPGEPAINPGPRKMITQAVNEVLKQQCRTGLVCIEVFVPEGIKLAQKTLNPRLGILGGISILGTTGIVKPMSHESYIATIVASLSVAHALGLDHVVLTTGRRSEKFAQELLKQRTEESFIQIGDFFQASLDAASKKGFKKITLAVLFGKAIKMAQGFAHTHAAKSSLSIQILADWINQLTGNQNFAEKIALANAARHALELILKEYPEIVFDICKRMVNAAKAFTAPNVTIQGIIFDYNGKMISQFESPGATSG